VTVPQKATLSLLISVLFAALAAVLAYTGLFDLVEARFYRPSLIREMGKAIEEDAGTLQGLLRELRGRFSATLENEAVRRSFLPNQTREDILERSRIYGELMTGIGGLQSVRFIDSAAVRIHFSTDARDVFRLEEGRIVYRNYHESPGFISFERVNAPDREEPKLTMDEKENRILFSFPFYDSYGAYRGTALFSLSVRTLADRFTAEGRIRLGEDLSLLAEPAGVLIGLPRGGRDALMAAAASVWKTGALSLTALEASGSEAALVLFSSKTDGGLYVGRMVDESLFILPEAVKAILLGAFFLTLYLSAFLIFNLRQDPVLVIQNRLKRLRLNLVEEYYDLKGDFDWDRWRRELEQRRGELHAELKRGIRFGRVSAGDADFLIDKFWDEFLAVIRGRREDVRDADIEEKIRRVLDRVLGQAAGPVPPLAAVPPEDAGELEELEAAPENRAAFEDAGAASNAEGIAEAAALEAVLELSPESEGDLPYNYGSQWGLEDLAGEIELGLIHDGAGTPPALEWEDEGLGEEEGAGLSGPFPEDQALLDSALVGYPEELSGDYQGFHLYIPFSAEFPEPLESLETAGGEAEPEEVLDLEETEGELSPGNVPDAVIEERDGIAYIRESLLRPGRPVEGLDPEFQGLIDSIITNRY
jgi:hypothetical protein